MTLPKDDVFRENQEHSCTTLTLDSSRENLTRNEYERGIFMVTTTKA